MATIGLNSTLVSGISRVSSVASSDASMASSASIVEREDDKEQWYDDVENKSHLGMGMIDMEGTSTEI